MPVTMLDPKTALIVIDLQKGIVGLPCAHPMGEIVQRSRMLLDAFRRHGLPVVLVNVDGAPPGRTDMPARVRDFPAGWTELAPELDRQPSDVLVTKQTRGAFTRTGLEEMLRGQGVTQVVIAGVATSAGVESTARQAQELGFHVTLAIDAMTDMNAEAHANSVKLVFPKIAETGTTAEILAMLESTRS